jgi:hypothetical protein
MAVMLEEQINGETAITVKQPQQLGPSCVRATKTIAILALSVYFHEIYSVASEVLS